MVRLAILIFGILFCPVGTFGGLAVEGDVAATSGKRAALVIRNGDYRDDRDKLSNLPDESPAVAGLEIVETESDFPPPDPPVVTLKEIEGGLALTELDRVVLQLSRSRLDHYPTENIDGEFGKKNWQLKEN